MRKYRYYNSSTNYKIFINFCSGKFFKCFYFNSEMLEDLAAFIFGLEWGGRQSGWLRVARGVSGSARHNKWVSGGWARNGQQGISPPPPPRHLTNGNIGFHSSITPYFAILENMNRPLKIFFLIMKIFTFYK